MSIFSKTFMYVVASRFAKEVNPVKGKDDFLQEIHHKNSQLVGKLATVTNTGKGMKNVVCRINGTEQILEGIGDVSLRAGDCVIITQVYTIAGFPRVEVELFNS